MTSKKIGYCLVLMAAITIGALFINTRPASAVSETGRSDYKLAEGVIESTIYAVDSRKNNQIIHVLRVKKGANVSVKAGYKNYYKKNSTARSRTKALKKFKWKWSPVLTHAKEYEKTKDKQGKVIAAASTDFIGSKGRPCGKLVMEGHLMYGASYEDYFAVLNNGEFAIRSGGSGTADVQEAVAGGAVSVSKAPRLVSGGKIKVYDRGRSEPRQAIGVTGGKDLVIVHVDGRDPTSVGVSLYDLAMIMKQQGCTEAINLDGGGSAAFLTKRRSNKSLKYRGIAGDGFIRNVCSSLMIVKNTKSAKTDISGPLTVSMVKSKTKLKKTSKGRYVYIINGKKQKGLFTINGKPYLFNKNGLGATKTIRLGKSKYVFIKGALKRRSAKNTGMGRIGAASGRNNILFAYNKSSQILNVGLNPMVKKNGRMKNWKANPTDLPWYASRARIRTINIGKGVKNVGNYFMYVSKSKVFDGSKAPLSKLRRVSLPSSLTAIGEYSFFYKPRLKNPVIPAKVRRIGKRAFFYSGKGTLRFKSKRPPRTGKNAYRSTGFKRVVVRNTSGWKQFNFRKFGYKGTVKYR